MNYVIINIDESQNFRKWKNGQENYSLYFLCYSLDFDFYKELSDFEVNSYYYTLKNQGKWKNIFMFLNELYALPDSYFFFPDPDLEIKVTDINKLFDIARDSDFDIVQPSLTQDSYCSHLFLKNKGTGIREVDFCEIMCPAFSFRSLARNLWNFNLNYSGYGIDFIWGKNNKCGVIDDIQIKHPRPCNYLSTAKKFKFPDPNRELKEIKRLYL